MQFKTINQLNIKNKVLFIRVDLNVPIKDGKITDPTRITAGLKTINHALNNGAKIIIATHLGRPKEGICEPQDSISPIAEYLEHELKQPIRIVTDLDTPIDFSTTNIIMLENVRCNIGEKSNSHELGKKYANLCDVFVHDAFATAHRAEASTDAIGIYAKEVCAGFLMSSELDALTQAIANPKRPLIAIVAGSKVSTKLSILNNLADKVDYLIVGGGILNTFLLANGCKIGKSLAEANLCNEARLVLDKMANRNAHLPLPQDIVVSNELSETAIATHKLIADINESDMILDVGDDFATQVATIIKDAGTVIWNGPLGVFEFDQFSRGTRIVANAIAASNCYSLAGGGDTIAAINKFGLYDKINYVSTAGGALLEFLEGKTLPAIKLLGERNNE